MENCITKSRIKNYIELYLKSSSLLPARLSGSVVELHMHTNVYAVYACGCYL